MRPIACLSLLLLLLLSGCDTPAPEQQAEPIPSKTQATSTNQPAQERVHQSIKPQLSELATGALPLWRQAREQKPALVLMSFDPFLKPIPAKLKQRATELVQQGDTADFDQHGSYFRADPVILPNQTLSAAIDAGLFSKIYWVFPAKTQPEQLDISKFRQQMTEADFFSAEEAASLTLENGFFSGKLRGLPFTAIHNQALTAVSEPLVLHIDLSYFKGLYDNEIKTPLYDLIHQTASTLTNNNWNPLVTTLSFSTLEGEIPLDTRFVISNLADILANPALLSADSMPAAWGLRAESLYAGDMFSESKKLELTRKAAELAPADPTALYDLFQAHFMAREIDQAIAVLDRAVALDPGYAAGYLALADMARQDNNPTASYELLSKAQPFFALNPFIDLQRADLLLQKGDREAALKIIDQLMLQSWSPVYRAEMPGLIDGMYQAATTPPAEENPNAE